MTVGLVSKMINSIYFFKGIVFFFILAISVSISINCCISRVRAFMLEFRGFTGEFRLFTREFQAFTREFR
jgi:hypothetical protein